MTWKKKIGGSHDWSWEGTKPHSHRRLEPTSPHMSGATGALNLDDQNSQNFQMAPILETEESTSFDIESGQSPPSQEPVKSPIKARTSTGGASNFTKRNARRTATAQIYHPQLRGRTWQPGQEPGISASSLQWPKHICDITVVDFSPKPDEICVTELHNDNLGAFLEKKQADWVTCRWINVNGIDSDVIKLLAYYKNFHRLAIEDMVNNKNRTKADWYTDHTYGRLCPFVFHTNCSESNAHPVVLPLQKLVHGKCSDSDLDEDGDSEEGYSNECGKKSMISRMLKAMNSRKTEGTLPMSEVLSTDPQSPGKGFKSDSTQYGYTTNAPRPTLTLQRYHAGPNEERIVFMERESALTNKGLAVSVEQVSIFLTSDNCVVSFFESSAPDIENPIVDRLKSSGTLLRRSADASMILQAIIDAIIDLAIPVTTAYQDAVEELELNVLTGSLPYIDV